MLNPHGQPNAGSGTASGKSLTLVRVMGAGTSISDPIPPSDSARKNSFVRWAIRMV
jgi:hypothetical protein